MVVFVADDAGPEGYVVLRFVLYDFDVLGMCQARDHVNEQGKVHVKDHEIRHATLVTAFVNIWSESAGRGRNAHRL